MPYDSPVGKERLRELERRWKETRSVEDETAYLVESARTGVLTRAALEAAAALGHPAAQVALDQHHAAKDLESLLLVISRLGSSALIRGMSALARGLLPAWERVLTDRRPHEALAAVDAWVDRPDRGRAAEAERAAELASASADRSGYHLAQKHQEGAFTTDERAAVEAVARAAQHTAEMAAGATLGRDPRALVEGPRLFCAALERTGLEFEVALGQLREALLPFLLGREAS